MNLYQVSCSVVERGIGCSDFCYTMPPKTVEACDLVDAEEYYMDSILEIMSPNVLLVQPASIPII